MRSVKKNRLVFTILFFLCLPVMSVRAEDSLLKIQALPDQNTIKAGMMFLVHARVVNSSPDTSTEFWGNTCSYEKHWVTDNPGVFIQSWTCNENTLEQITLSPGDAYEKSIIIYIPKEGKTEPVTFRLGFKRMSEDGDVAEPLWSDPVTMRVIVPDAPPNSETPASTDETSQTEDPESAAPAEEDEASQTSASEPATLAESQALVFQDPDVPIKVGPGKEFSISLVSNPSTGFRWKMTLPKDEKAVMLLGSEHVASQEVMPGVPGQEVFKFKALTVGETKATFVYERSWETKTAPTRKVFTILVQKN